MSAPEPLSIRSIVALMHASAEACALEVRALGGLASVRPTPGEWCANEVVGHLIEADRRGFAGRVRAVVEQDRPGFEKWDQPAVAAARHDDERDPEELVAEFLAARERDMAWVETLRPGALDRVGVHPRVGELSVRDILHEWVHHDREHLAQLLAVTQALAWPWMGNTQLFSQPKR